MSATRSIFDDDDALPVAAFKDPIPDFPEALKKQKIWLVWKAETDPKTGKINKIPHHPLSGKKTNNPEQGVTFEEAVSKLADYSGLGIYIGSGLIVVDIDNCVDSVAREIKPEGVDIVTTLNSFTELSYSGKGLHVFIYGKKPGKLCRKNNVEVYEEKRFLAVGGTKLQGVPATIETRDITPIYEKYLVEASVEPPAPKTTPEAQTQEQAPAKAAPRNKLIHHHGAFTNELKLLMTGDFVENSVDPFTVADADECNTMTFYSQSEAIASLLFHLAGKHKGDAEKINDEFLQSGLYQGITKWNAAGGKWDRLGKNEIAGAIKKYEKNQSPTTTAATPQAPASATTAADEEDAKIIEEKLPEFPRFTGSLADLADAMSPDIPWAFKFMTAATHWGLLRSGLDTLASEPHTQPRFYTALIARPGRGKSAAINETGKIMRGLSRDYKVLSSVESGPALVDAFEEQRNQGIAKTDVNAQLSEARAMAKILLSPDEIKGLFEKGKITTGSRNTLLDELLKLYEANETGNRARSVKAKIDMEVAHLSVVGGATESGYRSMWTGTGGSSEGLQSRVIPVGIDAIKAPAIQRPPDAEKLAVAIERLVNQSKAPARRFEISDKALAIFNEWWDAKEQDNDSETRIDGVIKRLLVILAATNDVDVIGVDLMQQAITFGDFVIVCRARYNPKDATNWVQEMEHRILDCFSKYGDMTRSKCSRIVHPDRHHGGVGTFNSAFSNLSADYLKIVSGAGKSSVYHLIVKREREE